MLYKVVLWGLVVLICTYIYTRCIISSTNKQLRVSYYFPTAYTDNRYVMSVHVFRFGNKFENTFYQENTRINIFGQVSNSRLPA